MSSVTEMILSAYIGWRWPQLGHVAIFVADAAMESASAITFTRMPHLQRQDATISTINSLQCFRQAEAGNCNAGGKKSVALLDVREAEGKLISRSADRRVAASMRTTFCCSVGGKEVARYNELEPRRPHSFYAK
jgi:hypothetical protein